MFTSESKARPYIQLFERRTVAGDGERYVGPKILAYHLGKAEQFRLFRARSTTSTRIVIRALRRNARFVRGGVVYVGFDGVFEYVFG